MMGGIIQLCGGGSSMAVLAEAVRVAPSAKDDRQSTQWLVFGK
jgi:hypothetical protein